MPPYCLRGIRSILVTVDFHKIINLLYIIIIFRYVLNIYSVYSTVSDFVLRYFISLMCYEDFSESTQHKKLRFVVSIHQFAELY